jgi:hypothetical protein
MRDYIDIGLGAAILYVVLGAAVAPKPEDKSDEPPAVVEDVAIDQSLLLPQEAAPKPPVLPEQPSKEAQQQAEEAAKAKKVAEEAKKAAEEADSKVKETTQKLNETEGSLTETKQALSKAIDQLRQTDERLGGPIDWVYDYTTALGISRILDRPVLVAMNRTGCSDCERVKVQCYADADFMNKIRREYVPYWSFNDFGLAAKWKITVWPKTAIIYPDREPIIITPPADPEAYRILLDKAKGQ